MFSRSPKLLVIPALCAIAALSLAACGGGGGSSDEDQIKSAINKALLGDNPADCDTLATQHFIDTLYGGDIAKCKADQTDTSDNPDSVDITKVVVNGDSATADVTAKGGKNDGVTEHFTFKKEDGDWKFDSAAITADAFLAKLRTQLQQGGLGASVVDCVINKLKGELTPEDLAALGQSAAAATTSIHDKAAAAGQQCATAALSK